jgi:hypothetical protein
MTDEDDTLTGADVFGEPVPGEAVTIPDADRYKRRGKLRPKFHRSPIDGRWLAEPADDVEMELPDDYYSRD